MTQDQDRYRQPSFRDPDDEARAEDAVRDDLDASLKRLTGRPDLGIADVRFPWHRSFEVDFVITGEVA